MKDDEAHFYSLLPHFQDARYFRFKGNPVFVIYRPQDHPYLNAFIEHWQSLASKEGLGSFSFLGITYDRNWTNEGLSGTVFHDAFLSSKRRLNFFDKGIKKVLGSYPSEIWSRYVYGCNRISYARMVDETYNVPLKDSVFPTIHTGWDNTPRSGSRGYVFYDFTPALFEAHASKAIGLLQNRAESLCFIKSWNEWAEGNYLEPDVRFGTQKLEALKRAIDHPSV